MIINTMNSYLTIFPVVQQLWSTVEKAAFFLHPEELPLDCSRLEDELDVAAACFWLCMTEGKSPDFSVMQFPHL